MIAVQPVALTCLDCERTFSLITELQIGRWLHRRGERCPTCHFNFENRDILGFIPRTIHVR